MKRVFLTFALLLPLVFIVLLWLWIRAPVQRPNLLLITVDTLRADHLGVYGYGRPTSPNIDALARSGAVFDAAFTHSTLSGPSHATIMTGLHPMSHGFTRNGFELDSAYLTVAEILRAAGYRTAMFVSHALVGERYGLAQGFDTSQLHHVDSHLHGHTDEERPAQEISAVFDAALAWIRTPQPAPFFVWLHVQHPHESYEPPPPYDRMFGDEPRSRHDLRCVLTVDAHREGEIELTRAEIEHVVALYDGEIAYMDSRLGQVIVELDRHERPTVVALTADHGEMLFDPHDPRDQGHAGKERDPVMRVPLILHDPRNPSPGRRIDEMVGLIDLAPTLLALAGVKPPRIFSGRSLATPARGVEPPVRQEVFLFSRHGDNRSRYAVRTKRRKLICESQGLLVSCRLFDLEHDPHETNDVADDAAFADDLDRLRAALDEWKEKTKGLRRLHLEHNDPATLELLQRAGYLENEE